MSSMVHAAIRKSQHWSLQQNHGKCTNIPCIREQHSFGKDHCMTTYHQCTAYIVCTSMYSYFVVAFNFPALLCAVGLQRGKYAKNPLLSLNNPSRGKTMRVRTAENIANDDVWQTCANRRYGRKCTWNSVVGKCDHGLGTPESATIYCCCAVLGHIVTGYRVGYLKLG